MMSVFEFLFGDASASEAVMNIILTVAGILVLVSLWNLHRRNGKYHNFNLVYLLVNKDMFPDGAKCMEVGAWLVMTWGFVTLVTTGKLSDAYTAAYVGAFAARGAFGAFMRSKGDPPQPEGTTVVTSTKVDTVEVSKTAPLKEPI